MSESISSIMVGQGSRWEPWRPLSLAAAAGFVLFLSAPPLMAWPLNFVAALLLAASVYDATPRAALGRGLTAGLFYWIFAAPWLVGTVSRFAGLPTSVGVVVFLLYGLAQSLMIAVQCYLAVRARPVLGRVMAVVCATLFCERYIVAVFAWQFAAPLVDAPGLSQSAEWLTVSGVSALVHGLSTSAVHALHTRQGDQVAHHRARRVCLTMVAATALMAVIGAVRGEQWRVRAESAPTVKVALVQANIAAAARGSARKPKEILQRLRALELTAAAANPDLIVLHEGAYPYLLSHRPGVDGVESSAIYTQPDAPPIVFGAMSAGEGQVRHNGVFLRNGDGTLSAPVAKRTLVPFGESTPVVNTRPWLASMLSLPAGISPGTGSAILTTVHGLRLGILVCLEDTLAQAGAEVAGADLLVNLTNDAWFVSHTALEEHLLMARWRSIELRRETVRAVNTGITARIDVLGRVVDRAAPDEETVLYVNAHRMEGVTLAPHVARHGGLIAGAVVIAAALAAWAAGRRGVRASDPRGP